MRHPGVIREGPQIQSHFQPETRLDLRYLDLGRARLRVGTLGQGTPLLLINGIGANLHVWYALASRLARRHVVIVFDAPGAGASPHLRRPLRMPGLARLVGALLHELQLPQVDVLGYSWGGALAQQLAHDVPNRVRRLVLASTSPGLGAPLPRLPVLALASTPFLYAVPRYFRWAAPRLFGGETPGHDLAALLAEPPGLRGYAQQAFAISGWTSLPWLHRITQPTLVLSGTDDPLVPVASARVLAERIPNAQLRLIPNGGHLWLIEQPADSAAVLDEFLG